MLAGDFMQTIERFLAIPGHGQRARQETTFASCVTGWRSDPPRLAALEAGLGLLAEVDLRDELIGLDLPWLRLYGRLDTLVPKAAISLAGCALPCQPQSGAGRHPMPFISHPEQFITLLRQFID